LACAAAVCSAVDPVDDNNADRGFEEPELDESDTPNSSSVACNSIAALLSFTISAGDAFCSADCNAGVDSVDVSGDPTLVRVCNRLARPAFVDATVPMFQPFT
jgi:hypothetical protein